MKTKYIILVIAFLSTMVLSLVSQNTGNFWFFGTNAGIDFSSGSPIGISGSSTGLEGSGVACDQNGDLLFYSDGLTVWDKNHNIMSNGSGLIGGASAAQSGLIVPIPQSCNRFLVLSTHDHTASGTLAYTEVDMNLNGGLGAVVVGSKNIVMYTNASEHLAVTKHANGIDYWIISRQRSSNQYSAFLLTSSGVNLSPVVSSGLSTIPANNTIGMMDINNAGTQIVTTNSFGTTFCELIQFDNNTGQMSFPIDLVVPYSLPTVGLYGVKFSPNDSLLYVTSFWNGAGEIHQLNLFTGIRTSIATAIGNYSICAIQRGPDDRLYFARGNESFIDVVQFPNTFGAGCGYLSSAVVLAPGTSCGYGLPSFTSGITSSLVGNFLGSDTTVCTVLPVTLSATIPSGSSIVWVDGSTLSSLTVPGTGTYWAEIDNGSCVVSDTIKVFASQNAIHMPDTFICPQDPLWLTGNGAVGSYLWSNGSSSDSVLISAPGVYWLEVTLAQCIYRDSFFVTQSSFSINIGNDTMLCPGSSILLEQPNPLYENLWNTNSTNSSILVNSPGNYWLDASFNGCTIRDSILIQYFSLATLNLGKDKVVCSDTTAVFLQSNITGSSYLWNTGAATSSILAHPDSTYILQVLDFNGCLLRDTIIVSHYTSTLYLGDDITACLGESFLLNVARDEFVDYLWSTGSENPSIHVSKSGTYSVLVKDQFNCYVSDTIEYTFDGCSLFIPSAFSPNEDEKNNTFRVYGDNISNFSIEIYNRWGEKVFETNDLADSWNGMWKSELAPMGVYTYKAEYKTTIDKTTHQKYGQIALIR